MEKKPEIKDIASKQLFQFAKEHPDKEQLQLPNGAFAGRFASQSVGLNGPLVLTDSLLIEELAHFDHERAPERVVHAKGTGAFGYFECTHDITQYTKNVVFSKIGKQTPILVRFSLVGGASGSADTVRDTRGFAIKFYTEDGIWDLVCNNTPIHFIRDPILFPSFAHVLKLNPATNVRDKSMFWDFMSLRPESLHQTLILFSDRGIPDGYRHMHGFGSHAFKMVNEGGNFFYCKFIFKTDQGIKNLMQKRAVELAGLDPDYASRDLYDAIADGKYPSWTLYVQIMTPEQAHNCKEFNPFDLTKIWPHAEYPLMEVGKLVLNKNPENFYTEIEEAAFAPSHMIQGIEASPDKMLQARLFSYPDTQRHRLGANFRQIPVNSPRNVRDYHINGPMNVTDNHSKLIFKGCPNYFPNSFNGPQPNEKYLETIDCAKGSIERFESIATEIDDMSQAKEFWRKVLTEDERQHLIENMADHLLGAADFIQHRAINNFKKCDEDLGKRVKEEIEKLKKEKV